MLKGVKLYSVATKGLYPKVQTKTSAFSEILLPNKHFSANTLRTITSITKQQIPTQIIKRTFFWQQGKTDDSQAKYQSDEPTVENLLINPLSGGVRSLLAFIAFFVVAFEGIPFIFNTFYTPFDEKTLSDAKSDDEQKSEAAYQKLYTATLANGVTKMDFTPAVDVLLAGTESKNVFIQYLAVESLKNLSNNKEFRTKMASNISWDKISALVDKEDITGTNSVLGLMHALALPVNNVPLLIKNDIVPFLDAIVKSGKSIYLNTAVHTLVFLSRNEEGASYLVDELPQLYSVWKQSEPGSENSRYAAEAIANVLKSNKLTPEQRRAANKFASETAEIAEISSFVRKPQKPLGPFGQVAMVIPVAAVWGAARWAVARNGNLQGLQVRVPMTILGAVTLALMGSINAPMMASNNALVKNVVEPVVGVASTAVFWAVINVAPYSIVPSIFPTLLQMWNTSQNKDALWDAVNEE
eukprot:gnl/Spiro4/6672_TR3444_c0_g1_i1.p1 gnl/Spiro4/6672_TR3444_c0_g1~~gnl/Spiro4/6672_TR3444_c0_g1_i1.p1  ORF type:complete len:469 (-),score=-42.32 gnl/Spiro4/6672_TR3444_c0_g1_i1:78-1484(-)